jgi:ADP-ribose pyrophosphatase
MDQPAVVSAQTQSLSPWVSVVTRLVEWPGCDPQTYHSIAQADYVSVLAISRAGRIPLVKQFRPALERHTLELPGGIIDTREQPASVAARELYEETGFNVSGAPVLLGNLVPDTGRLENRYWCFFVDAQEPAETWTPEPRVERVLYTRAQLREAILDGTFDHALHVALIGLAIMHGCFSWEE